jgi:hypothetical protein
MSTTPRHQDSNTVTIAADTTPNAVIDARISSNPPLTNGSVNAQFLFVTASNFTSTANGTGDNFTIGDDVKIGDVNVANTLGLKGIQDPAAGYIKFGTSGPIFGYTNSGALPASGTAVTGSLLQSGSNLYFYNGTSGTAGGVRGWATVI